MLRRWLWISLRLICHALADEHFDEMLHLRPLQDGRLYMQFSFTTLLKDSVPRSPVALNAVDEPLRRISVGLGQIIREYAVSELHLSLNAGKWDYCSWEHPDDAGVGSGAELWVPLSTVHLTVVFDKMFLRYTDHPPDTQRGWDLPPAVLVPLPLDSASGSHSDTIFPRMYTNTLLVDLATRDFSMPYNVIFMNGLLASVFIGSVFNLLTRDFVAIKLI